MDRAFLRLRAEAWANGIRSMSMMKLTASGKKSAVLTGNYSLFFVDKWQQWIHYFIYDQLLLCTMHAL